MPKATEVLFATSGGRPSAKVNTFKIRKSKAVLKHPAIRNRTCCFASNAFTSPRFLPICCDWP